MNESCLGCVNMGLPSQPEAKWAGCGLGLSGPALVVRRREQAARGA
ncbi:hypothetical protein C8E87_6945 [Paractinoplanes brasiliensis]|uniref:Uncharacterized protein n=1 Tax=Paractinoplanes brasiliensis TaxID=52695 RepID=A0A4R6J7M7_9ACTN|nr:hypothetical protein C8E87_6945 [Actinoplanes brasiliensis]